MSSTSKSSLFRSILGLPENWFCSDCKDLDSKKQKGLAIWSSSAHIGPPKVVCDFCYGTVKVLSLETYFQFVLHKQTNGFDQEFVSGFVVSLKSRLEELEEDLKYELILRGFPEFKLVEADNRWLCMAPYGKRKYYVLANAESKGECLEIALTRLDLYPEIINRSTASLN